MAIYPRWELNPAVWWQWSFPLTAFSLPVVLYFLRRKIGAGPLLAALFFGITLELSVGFINFPLMVYSYVADRFQYLAGLGPIILFAAGFDWLRARWKIPQPIAAGMICALLAVCAVKTHFQARLYQDTEALFAYNYRYNPADPYLNDKLGLAYLRKAKFEPAARHFAASLERAPHDANIRYLHAVCLAQSNRHEQAIAEFQTAVRQNPDLLPAWQGLGDCYLKTRQWEQAEGVFRTLLERNPDSRPAQDGLSRSRQAGAAENQRG